MTGRLFTPQADPLPPVEPAEPVTALTARGVKDGLLRRHPADQFEWTCIEEWLGIDLLAWSAWGKRKRVGYEVKVSRSDYRRELLKPGKRLAAQAFCNEFYMAVPKGLLTKDELAYEESMWEDGDFERERCPAKCVKGRRSDYGYDRRYLPRAGTVEPDRVPIPLVASDAYRYATMTDEQHAERCADRLHQYGWTYRACRRCNGKGYVKGSRVEREAPTLWIPRDVGLIEVTAAQARVVRKSPVTTARELPASEVAHLVRWVSQRPDPRHLTTSIERHERQAA